MVVHTICTIIFSHERYTLTMNVMDCIRKMIDGSGKSARQVSRELGRSPNYLSATFSGNSDVGASNVARIAKILGWRLVPVRDRDGKRDEIEITPPDNSK